MFLLLDLGWRSQSKFSFTREASMINGRIAGPAAIAAALSLAVTAPCARAEGEKVRWMGDMSCGSWISAGSTYDAWPKVTAVNWVLGFLSHSAIAAKTDLLVNVDQPSVAAWMDNYCQGNPLNSVFDGARTLELDLFSRARPKPNR